MIKELEGLKALKIDPKVIGSPKVYPVILALDPYFERASQRRTITSILRDPAKQLSIIEAYAKQKQILKPGSTLNFIDKVTLGDNTYPKWQYTWSLLLHLGVIINPPVRAEVLLDYIGKDGKNKKGQFINPSEHFEGKAFDIGGNDESGNPNPGPVVKIIEQAQKDGLPISYALLERQNNCVHVVIA